MIQNTENAKKTLFTIGGLIVILLLSFLVASDEVLLSYEKYEISAANLKSRNGINIVLHTDVWSYWSYFIC